MNMIFYIKIEILNELKCSVSGQKHLAFLQVTFQTSLNNV